MFSGRYPTAKLTRNWTQNRAGICELPSCTGRDVGSLEHVLLFCPALFEARAKVVNLAVELSNDKSELASITSKVIDENVDPMYRMQFILDPSSLPSIIRLCQIQGKETLELAFKISRNWCYSLHRARMTQLGHFQFR